MRKRRFVLLILFLSILFLLSGCSNFALSLKESDTLIIDASSREDYGSSQIEVTSEEFFVETTVTEAYGDNTDTQNVTETEKEHNNISSEIKNGLSYGEVVAILGEEYTELEGSCFWRLSDGSTLQTSFAKTSNDERSVNYVYNYTACETGIKRPTDISEVDRMTISYMGYKARAIEISDAAVISEIVEMIKNTKTDYIGSARNYSGCTYNIEILLKSGETFYFDLWGENMLSTNEYKDNNYYNMVSYTNVSQLYKYMEEHFPEDVFRN